MADKEITAYNLGQIFKLAFELGVTYALICCRERLSADEHIDDPEESIRT